MPPLAVIVCDRDRERLRELVAVLGERGTAARLELSRHALARAIAGLPLRKGTVLLIQHRLRRQRPERGAA